jgi:hypothetical protein
MGRRNMINAVVGFCHIWVSSQVFAARHDLPMYLFQLAPACSNCHFTRTI